MYFASVANLLVSIIRCDTVCLLQYGRVNFVIYLTLFHFSLFFTNIINCYKALLLLQQTRLYETMRISAENCR